MLFHFKQFSVKQERSAMKLGTDGVLLGAWAFYDKPQTILDIGTGTGVIALQMAQRYPAADIHAIDIDEDAYKEAGENFDNSGWSNRLNIYHTNLINFSSSIPSYQLIVSNPPYFDGSYKSKDNKRDKARHQESLDYKVLLRETERLLSSDGKACYIIPFSTENNFLAIAKNNHLFADKITHVKGTENSKIKRSLIRLSRNDNQACEPKILILEKKRHVYTEDYKKLVEDFYLKSN